MNNTVKALTKGMRGSHFLSIITTGCVTSLLTLGVAIAPSEAADLKGTVENLWGEVSSDILESDPEESKKKQSWETKYKYEVSYTWDDEKKEGSVTIKQVDGLDGAKGTNGWYATIPITAFSDGKPPSITFGGSDIPYYESDKSEYDRGTWKGSLKDGKLDFTYNNSIRNYYSQPTSAPEKKDEDTGTPPTTGSDRTSTKIPESSSPITLLAFGILGTGAIVKRHLKSAKTSQKQSDHNSTDYPQKEVSKVS